MLPLPSKSPPNCGVVSATKFVLTVPHDELVPSVVKNLPALLVCVGVISSKLFGTKFVPSYLNKSLVAKPVVFTSLAALIGSLQVQRYHRLQLVKCHLQRPQNLGPHLYH